MKNRTFITLLFATLLLTACDSKSDYAGDVKTSAPRANSLQKVAVSGEMIELADDLDVPASEIATPSETTSSNRLAKKKIVRDGRMRIQVENLSEAKSRLNTLVQQCGGYYGEERMEKGSREDRYQLKIRIPVERFETFVDDLEKQKGGKVLQKELQARDVTEQFLDLELRLKNKRGCLEQYRKILERANTTSEILSVQREVRMLEEEIESATGRLHHLDDLITWSTLDLTLLEEHEYKYVPESNAPFPMRFKESFARGWNNLLNTFLGLLACWPINTFLLLLAITAWCIYRSKRKAYLKKREEKDAA